MDIATLKEMLKDWGKPVKPLTWKKYLGLVLHWQEMTDGFAKASRDPEMGDLLRKTAFRPEGYDVTYIPVNESLKSGETIVPLDVLKEFIRRSPHRVIVGQCACRQGNDCMHYNRDIGCIYLGDATKDMDPSMGKHATVEEAIAHVDKAAKAGLVAKIGQIDLDAMLLGCSPASHFASVCFCCSCCCIAMRNGTVWDDRNRECWHRMEGLVVEIDKDICIGCEECVSRCFMGAISIQDEKAAIDDDNCKGCGVCVENCPVNAISIKVVDAERMRMATFERIDSRVDIVHEIPGKEVNKGTGTRVPHPRELFPGPEGKSQP